MVEKCIPIGEGAYSRRSVENSPLADNNKLMLTWAGKRKAQLNGQNTIKLQNQRSSLKEL